MIIGNFNVMGMAVVPMKADPPLVIDPYAPLAFSVAAKLLQTVSRGNPEKRQCRCGVELSQLAQGHPLYFLRQAARESAVKNPFCLLAAK
jgi:hypothetical protein